MSDDLESTLFEPHAKMGPEECFHERFMFHQWLVCQGTVKRAKRLGVSFDELATMEIDKINFHLNLLEEMRCDDVTRKIT